MIKLQKLRTHILRSSSRHFSATQTAEEIKILKKCFEYHQPEKLYSAYQNFRINPKDLKSAHIYLRELNRHKRCHKVLEEAKKVSFLLKYERLSSLPFFQLMMNYSAYKKVYAQVKYAEQHIEAMSQIRREQFSRIDKKFWDESGNQYPLFSLFIFFSPYIFIFGFFYTTNQRFPLQSYSEMRKQKIFTVVKPEEIKENISDIRGINEIREEVENLIQMLKTPEAYYQKGAKQIAGVLLMGQPGTGKTMLARAIAKESGVNFIYQSGSSFDELFVGMGGLRVKQLFEEARKNQPCVIFIDEIDSLFSAKRRHNESSSSRGTLNMFLSEMDGFTKDDKIMLIGATNEKEENIDKAAVRPGRFDNKIVVPIPDERGRNEIFELYLGKIKHSQSKWDLELGVKSDNLALMTPGFTGAQIQNLVNTAICEAVHDGKEEAGSQEFDEARDRIMMGIERKNLTQTDKDRLKTAIHEAGHALTCYFTPGALKLYKATIVSRGGSLGATHFTPDNKSETSQSKERMVAMIDVAMGGHVAEEIYIGKRQTTSGCSGDFAGATNNAEYAITQLGMFSELTGFVSEDKKKQSEERQAEIDEAIRKVTHNSYERVSKLLESKREEFRRLAKALYHYDYLDAEEIEKVIKGEELKKDKVRQWDTSLDGSTQL